jgi:uncharacterized membrane protein SpoIIM required for sporulation
MENIIVFLKSNPIFMGILFIIIGIGLLIIHIKNKKIIDSYRREAKENYVNSNPIMANEMNKIYFVVFIFSIFLIIFGIGIIIICIFYVK